MCHFGPLRKAMEKEFLLARFLFGYETNYREEFQEPRHLKQALNFCRIPSFSITPTIELYSEVFTDYFTIGFIPEGLLGQGPVMPSFGMTRKKILMPPTLSGCLMLYHESMMYK